VGIPLDSGFQGEVPEDGIDPSLQIVSLDRPGADRSV
jgi:hypothetical protein